MLIRKSEHLLKQLFFTGKEGLLSIEVLFLLYDKSARKPYGIFGEFFDFELIVSDGDFMLLAL
jgi:hypothetical protein